MKIGDSLLHILIQSIFLHLLGFLNFDENLDKGEYGEIGEHIDPPHIRCIDGWFQCLWVLHDHILMHFPHQQEGVSDILIRRAVVLINSIVYDFRDFVNKDHDIFLKDLCGVSEGADITEPEDRENLLPWDDRIDRI